MKILELCCGTANMTKSFRIKGHQVVSVDIDANVNPDIVADLMHTEILGEYDIIWAAPECKCYCCMTMGKNWKNSLIPRTMSACKGSALLVRCLEIILEKNPKIWMIENPRAMMRNHMGRNSIGGTTTQCQYGKEFQKYTDIFSNKKLPLLPGCKNGMTCHKAAVRGSTCGTQGADPRITASYPTKLCDHIVEICEKIAKDEGWYYI
jgi:hypothetical protein